MHKKYTAKITDENIKIIQMFDRGVSWATIASEFGYGDHYEALRKRTLRYKKELELVQGA